MMLNRRKSFVICDSNSGYLQGLQDYLVRKNLADFDIIGFSDVASMLEYGARQPIDILLLNEGMYDEKIKSLTDSVVLMLSEDGSPDIESYPLINKFQSVNGLLKEVMDIYATSKTGVEAANPTNTKVYSFYSPKRECQSVMALSFGRMLAESGKKVLYLNLTAHTGFGEIFMVPYEANVLDFIYFIEKYKDKNELSKITYKLDALKKNIYGMDYLLPALDYIDLMEVPRNTWIKAIELMVKCTGYDCIVLDLSENCTALYDLLKISNMVYTVISNDKICQASIREYAGLLEKRELGSILGKTRYISVDGISPDYTSLIDSQIMRGIAGDE